jgi:hypothetical protein
VGWSESSAAAACSGWAATWIARDSGIGSLASCCALATELPSARQNKPARIVSDSDRIREIVF